MKKILTSITFIMLTTGCSYTGKYNPEGYNESDLALISGSNPGFLGLPPEGGNYKESPFYVSIAKVHDEKSVERIKRNAWSGHYEQVLLPEGTYILSGNCWRGQLYTPYKIKVVVSLEHKYQLHCLVSDLQYSGNLFSLDKIGNVRMFIEDITDN